MDEIEHVQPNVRIRRHVCACAMFADMCMRTFQIAAKSDTFGYMQGVIIIVVVSEERYEL